LTHWCNDPNNVYVGRKGILIINGRRYPEKDSIWTNPYKVDSDDKKKDGKLAEVLYKYWYHLDKMLSENPNLIQELKLLRGKRLGCWCVNQPYIDANDPKTWVCHTQILAYFVNVKYKDF
jgi:hypothetical protein